MQSLVLLPATAALTALLASAFGLVSYGTTRAGMVGWYRWQHRPTSLGVEEKIRCGSRKVRAHWGIVYHVVGRPCHINSCFCKLAQRQGYPWYHTYIPYHHIYSCQHFILQRFCIDKRKKWKQIFRVVVMNTCSCFSIILGVEEYFVLEAVTFQLLRLVERFVR